MTEKPTIRVIEKQRSAEAIQMLEDILARARKGEVVGVVIISSYSDNGTGHCWGGVENNGKRLVGEMVVAMNDLAGHYA